MGRTEKCLPGDFLRAVLMKQQCREQMEGEDVETVLVDNSEDRSDEKGCLRWERGDKVLC